MGIGSRLHVIKRQNEKRIKGKTKSKFTKIYLSLDSFLNLIPMPSSELLFVDSLITISSLGTSFGVCGALEEASAMGGTDVLEATEREPSNNGTKAKEGVGVRAEGRADDAEIPTYKTSLAPLATDLLALKLAKVSFILSMDKMKFLGSLMVPNSTSEAEKEN